MRVSALAALASLGPLDAGGGALSAAALEALCTGKRVGLYFSAQWCPMCRNFEPALLQFRQACADSGKPVELIYVPSDNSEREAKLAASNLRMPHVPFGDSAALLKKEHNVWSGREAMKLGFGRRSGVPAIVVLNPADGSEAAFIDAESRGPAALSKWPLDEHVF